MTWATDLLLLSLGCALLALVLSIGSSSRWTRPLARASIWIVALAIPVAILEAIWGASGESLQLSRGLSAATSSGALALPAAVIASVALRRSSRATHRGRN